MEIHPTTYRATYAGLHASATTPERWQSSVDISIAREPVIPMRSLEQPRMGRKGYSRMGWQLQGNWVVPTF